MKKHIVGAMVPLMLLAACGESEEPAPAETAAAVDLAAGTGAYMVTFADGTHALNYATTDGVYYGGMMEGADPATWSVVDGRVCVDPPGEPADGESGVVCLNAGELNADGSWTATVEGDTREATMRRIDTVATSPADQISAGAYLADGPEDGPLLVVWTDDGKSYLARNVTRGTWHAENGQRCEKLDDAAEESCSTPGPMNEDGSFTVDDNGQQITVTML